ncbi:MAG: porin family protein [Holophagales bacterium]|nr:porin family protein [Holophagales bacterium]
MFLRHPSSVWLLIALSISLFPFAPTPVAAAEVEVTPTVGYRFSSGELIAPIGCIASIIGPCPDRADVEDSASAGITVNIGLADRWMFELLWNLHSSDLRVPVPICPFCEASALGGLAEALFVFPEQELDIETLQVGALRRWQVGRVQPFAAVGAGISQISVERPPFGIFDFDEDRPSSSLAGGVKIPFGSFLGLRLEARGYWIDLPSELSDDDLIQTELSSGLMFRW